MMARLTEEPVSTESIETLRRKFLRQNRDIARINSAQSLRIRSLESECGRLLSDNLTLNSRILELEKDLDKCRAARRVADHALEIKAKMEAQLAEWEAMIQGLGEDSAPKRRAMRSPGGTRRIARVRISGKSDPSPAARQRPRDSRTTNELAAIQHEGRLPPIHEDNSNQRRTTMSHAELLAMCDQATEVVESPDLGPPPTSRFVEVDPVKIDSPSRSTGSLQPSAKIIKGEALPRPDALSQPKSEPEKKTTPAIEEVPTQMDIVPAAPADSSLRTALRAGSKRKYGDGNDENQVSKAMVDKEASCNKSATLKPLVSQEVHNRSILIDPSKKPRKIESMSARPRKALAEKSINDDTVSPKKRLFKAVNTDDLQKNDRLVAPLKKKRVVSIKMNIPHLPAPSIEQVPQELAHLSADPGLVFPETPETKSTAQNPADTPPPADISVHGETSRPSRRVRAAISYAEPNLRDKMRRPTKELFDAVAGEGKLRRTSSVQPIGPLSSSNTTSTAKQLAPEESVHAQNAEGAMVFEAAHRPHATNSLEEKQPQKEQLEDDLAKPVTTERGERSSLRQSQLFELRDEAADADGMKDEMNLSKYQTISPVNEMSEEAVNKGRITQGLRRSMASRFGQEEAVAPSNRPLRKRASMAAPKQSLVGSLSADDDSYHNHSGELARPETSTKERVSRRRSMRV